MLGKFSNFSDHHSRNFSPYKREFSWSKNIFDTQSCSSRLIFSSIFSFTHTPMWRHFWGERSSRTYFWPFLICCIWQCYRVFSVARIVNKALRSVFWVFLVGAARIIQRRKLRRSRKEKSWSFSSSKDHRIFQFLQIFHQENESSHDIFHCFVIGGEEVLVCEWKLFLGIQDRLTQKCVNKLLRRSSINRNKSRMTMKHKNKKVQKTFFTPWKSKKEKNKKSYSSENS